MRLKEFMELSYRAEQDPTLRDTVAVTGKAGEFGMKLDELRDYCSENNIPLDWLGIALDGDRCTKPKWRYVYLDTATNEWVVARNRADGSKLESYRGQNEEEAVGIMEETIMIVLAALSGFTVRARQDDSTEGSEAAEV